ncbi:MAG TPA: alpha/beta hydrolase [Verrucomicrobiota bacterium]|nr:alpha/beta hydrolase [Verrucomicrobiota bacterium]
MRFPFPALLLTAVLPLGAAEPRRTEDVIYGRKFGTALTMDVFEPALKNRAAVILIVSGGFHSSKEAVNPALARRFTDRGYTVFAVVHGSQPRYVIPEIQEDLHRGVRFIRHQAGRWGVDPQRFGATGGSAGGHLSLVLATQGGPGAADAKDPVDRESSAVQAAACFFRPTDFLNWGEPGDVQVGIGRVGRQFYGAFGPRSDRDDTREAYGREISPLYFVTAKMAPALIIHGDADKLVPLYQAEIFAAKAKAAGATCEVIVREGRDHGWPGMEEDLDVFADWFDRHLLGKAK